MSVSSHFEQILLIFTARPGKVERCECSMEQSIEIELDMNFLCISFLAANPSMTCTSAFARSECTQILEAIVIVYNVSLQCIVYYSALQHIAFNCAALTFH